MLYSCFNVAFMLCVRVSGKHFSVLIVCDQIPEYFRLMIVCIYSVPFSHAADLHLGVLRK